MSPKQNQKLKPNVVLFGIDSLLSEHMSCYGYDRLTTPHIDRFAEGGTLFEKYFLAHTFPRRAPYSSMLTGRDCFGTQVVRCVHKGPLRPEVRTLAEILRDEGYTSTCVGFRRQPGIALASISIWIIRMGQLEPGTQPQGAEPERCHHSRTGASRRRGRAVFPVLTPHGPARALSTAAPYERMFYHGQ
jgi:hypothetical protein